MGVPGERRSECGPRPFHLLVARAEVTTRGQDEPHRAGQAVEDRCAGGASGELVSRAASFQPSAGGPLGSP